MPLYRYQLRVRLARALDLLGRYDDLTALGQQRAMAVQQALLTNTQLDPARVFLAVNDKAKKQDGEVRLELSLR